MVKWIGAAAWSAKEARVGDRLPYARLVDENTVLLRDGSVMSAIQVPGLLFETEDSDALNAHAVRNLTNAEVTIHLSRVLHSNASPLEILSTSFFTFFNTNGYFNCVTSFECRKFLSIRVGIDLFNNIN
jgi:hypothetical protein